MPPSAVPVHAAAAPLATAPPPSGAGGAMWAQHGYPPHGYPQPVPTVTPEGAGGYPRAPSAEKAACGRVSVGARAA